MVGVQPSADLVKRAEESSCEFKTTTIITITEDTVIV